MKKSKEEIELEKEIEHLREIKKEAGDNYKFKWDNKIELIQAKLSGIQTGKKIGKQELWDDLIKKKIGEGYEDMGILKEDIEKIKKEHLLD